MKRPAPAPSLRGRPKTGKGLKGLAALDSIRASLATGRPAAAPASLLSAPAPAPPGPEPGTEFVEAMRGVTPLRRAPLRPAANALPAPDALQRARDDRAALDESLAAEIGIESLLDTDEALSYRREGIGPDTLRKLRRGFWVVQAELDLHGHRVEEARHALGEFLKRSIHRGWRCVRIVHGKGLGSRDGIPVLKGKVKKWLTRHEVVIAFCQAPPADGGAGALLVLLRPSAAPG